jgi:hypothetical protein
LRVHEVRVDTARVGERVLDGALRDLAERDPARLLRRDVGGLGHVPRDRLALAVEVRGEVDGVRAAGRLLDVGDLLAAIVADDVLGLEVVVDVDAELALARVVRQIADMTVRGENPVVVSQVPFDRSSLRRRLDDDKVLRHRGGV